MRLPVPPSDWSATALSPFKQWPWQRKRTARPAVADDPGPGQRSGFGSLTVLPYLVKSEAGKLRPDDPPAGDS